MSGDKNINSYFESVAELFATAGILYRNRICFKSCCNPFHRSKHEKEKGKKAKNEQ